MALVKFEQGAMPVNVEGEIKYAPAIRLGDGDFSLISHQDQVIYYDTPKEAEQYFED
jgi:hypothetical protein